MATDVWADDECDWAGCAERRAGAMRFCKDHGHGILLGRLQVPGEGAGLAGLQQSDPSPSASVDPDAPPAVGPSQ